jgi:ribose/xylose/arabinose/galactoside ABC-type transport system permease subunit
MTGTRRAELVLAGVLVAEWAIFARSAPNFATSGNAAEIVRLGVEVGLLALALTPIVVTGGIDLSCGALLGLSAVVFGALWRDAGWPPWAASFGALAIGAMGGASRAGACRR